MAVVIETTLGDITVDLFLDRRPITCMNFLKLCKMKYYNFNLFHTIRSGFIAQTGDPTGEGSGGKSIWGILEGPEKRFFSAEKMPKIRHTDAGLLSMVCTDDMMVGSQFFITLASNLDSLDGVHCVIGEVTEGHEVLRKLNEVICDESHRPYRDVRITHTVVLEDPFNDPAGLRAPSRSPSPNIERLKGGRIAPDEQLDEAEGKSAAEIQEMIEEKEAKARATILEIVGDLPDADIAPPENVLFVCKLNPVTSDEDLEIIFSRFGKIVSCEVIRDRKTGDSLQYAFIEFDDKKSCENAYFKMDNVLIDDRRIHVDFSQSVSKMQWLGKGRGVRHIKDDSGNDGHINKPRRSKSRERNQIDHHHKNRERESNRQNRSRDTEKHSEHKSERKSKYETSQRGRVRSPVDNSRDNRQTKPDRNYRLDRNDRNGRDNRQIKPDKNDRLDRNGRDNRQIKPDRNERNVKSPDDGRDRNHKRESDTAKEEKQKYEHRKTYSSNKHSPPRNNRKESESAIRDHKNYNSRDVSKDARENSNHKNKIKKLTNESSCNSKRSHNELTPRTPSPVVKNKTDKNGSLNERKKRMLKIHKKKSQVKKKRAESTSSSSDSESSSETSSSESSSTSSSSSEDKKRKKSSRKRKYSSSSSSDSSSSSSSSSDSSTSSSSSSDSEVDRKKSKKKVKKVQIKNSKKKL